MVRVTSGILDRRFACLLARKLTSVDTLPMKYKNHLTTTKTVDRQRVPRQEMVRRADRQTKKSAKYISQ